MIEARTHLGSNGDGWKYAFEKIYRVAVVLTIILSTIYLIAGFFSPREFFQSYLVGYIFWIEISLGCLGILMIYYLTGGYWGVSIRGLLEAGGSTLWLMAVLFLPIPFGLASIYKWARIGQITKDSVLQHQSLYLNPGFFTVRGVLYFILWTGLFFLLGRAAGNKPLLSKISAVGLIVYSLSATFASYDWLMSLQNDWYSTIFGMIFVTSHALGAMAFVILVATYLSRFKSFSGVYPPQCMNDLGNILLVFVMLWAYLSFSQFLIIWAGNKPQEVEWYLRRVHGGWEWLAKFLILFQFGVPFILLLFKRAKRKALTLAIIAGIVFCIRIIDVFWSIIPGFSERSGFHWMHLLSPIAVGAIWIVVFMHQILRRTLPQVGSKISRSYFSSKSASEEV